MSGKTTPGELAARYEAAIEKAVARGDSAEAERLTELLSEFRALFGL
ncbi:MAG TPA: hypothetical protein VGG75_13700 [Trebonia sp.]